MDSKGNDRGGSPLSRAQWYWPPRPLAVVVAGSVLVAAVLANLPAVSVPHPELIDGKFGYHFNLTTEYEHGWPLRYARRSLSLRTQADGPPPAWQPWEGPGERSIVNLLLDGAIWSIVLLALAAGAQYWRSRRRAVWQLDLRDLLVLTGVAGVAFAWLAATRLDAQREQSFLAEYRQRLGNPEMQHEVGARVPAWWPDWLQRRYREAFNRTCYYRSNGDSDLACQHAHVVTLRETAVHRDFRRHLRQMPGLEALDLSYVELPYFDATRQTTVVGNLAPLPNLRGINLGGTYVTDTDMSWLGTCSRLEVIDLVGTDIGDHGLAHLAKLPRLRILNLSSDRISDRGCRSIAAMSNLEELSLASRNVKDAGLRQLAALTRLKRLEITVGASKAAVDALETALPECKLQNRRTY
jgi:hypothetical protein